MVKSEVRTLQMQFLDAGGAKVLYAMKNPKSSLTKAEIAAAAKVVIDNQAFESKNGLLASLDESRIVTRKVEVLE